MGSGGEGRSDGGDGWQSGVRSQLELAFGCRSRSVERNRLLGTLLFLLSGEQTARVPLVCSREWTERLHGRYGRMLCEFRGAPLRQCLRILHRNHLQRV
mmetsp:Transcript_18334/g.26433  ORF Transcript_18334/g.26433 Transcript_18334/m.26433 type:complete len:99 (-) Transcript_18334:137-433(-)